MAANNTADTARHFLAQGLLRLALAHHTAAKPKSAVRVHPGRGDYEKDDWLADERAMDLLAKVGNESFVPGVPLSVWSFKGSPAIVLGVTAQDLEKVHPKHVRTASDGLKHVSHQFAPSVIWEGAHNPFRK